MTLTQRIGQTYAERKAEAWRRDTHERTSQCRPCVLLPSHCDQHGKRFADATQKEV